MIEDRDKEETPDGEDHHAEGEDVTLLEEQLEEALREKDQFRTMAQRAQADLENYRRRVVEEQSDLRRHAISGLLINILSVVDDFERALDIVPEDAKDSGWVEGLRLVHRNLQRALESEGVSVIEAEGQLFEPREHEAVFFEETEGSEAGRVVTVVRNGYKLHDVVLRAAQVTVSKPPESDEGSQADDAGDEVQEE